VTVPVLALHRRDDEVVPASNADHIAAHVPVGRAALLPGGDSAIRAGDVDAIAAHIENVLPQP
jgi:pimeloyl-ACP methyl ester carboxylesterase